MTDLQYQAWLTDPSAIRVVLIEANANISGTETTIYMSTSSYVTNGTDTPSNQYYIPVVETGIQYTEDIPVNVTIDGTSTATTAGTSSMTGGDISIFNLNGELDAWLGYAWINRKLNAYIGDTRWGSVGSPYTRSDFRPIFTGIISDINSASFDRLNLIISDKTAQLNTPITSTLLGGTTPNANVLIPLLFGECFNITPLLINPATLQYQVHNGPIESIIEVRDNGVPVPFTPNVATGTFALNQSPVGTITCSAQGDKPVTYSNTISQIIQRIVTGYGLPTLQFKTSDLDVTNLFTFDSTHQQPVGIYITGADTVLTTIQNLAASVGAVVIMSRAGLLQIQQIDFTALGTPTIINAYQIDQHSLNIQDRSVVVSSINLGYCQNWTNQTLTTNLPAADLSIYSTDTSQINYTDTVSQALYNLPNIAALQQTYLIVKSDAQAECVRQVNVFKQPRTTYQLTANYISGAYTLLLGQACTIINPRFGMSTGKTGIIIGLAPDWITGKVTVKVLI